jgi:2-polyprenyl-3-methyl-5-hydroxy-6-metoxy-1,4-benzoquinol methylase
MLTISTEKEFDIKINGTDIIFVKEKKIFYAQIKTLEGTLTGSQVPRSIEELSIHKNSYFVAAFETGTDWTFNSDKIQRLKGKEFWSLIELDYDHILNEVKKIVSEYKLQKKKIIEIGCGKGAMLDIFKKARTYPYGLEWNANSVAYGKRNNRNIIKGFIENIKKIPFGPFDMFVCFNFLEHMPNPNKAVKNIFNNVNDNALGIITVPNLDYLLKTNCFYEFVPDHLLYFKKKNIEYLFKKNSFQIINCKTINNENDIQVIVKKITNKHILLMIEV